MVMNIVRAQQLTRTGAALVQLVFKKLWDCNPRLYALCPAPHMRFKALFLPKPNQVMSGG